MTRGACDEDIILRHVEVLSATCSNAMDKSQEKVNITEAHLIRIEMSGSERESSGNQPINRPFRLISPSGVRLGKRQMTLPSSDVSLKKEKK